MNSNIKAFIFIFMFLITLIFFHYYAYIYMEIVVKPDRGGSIDEVVFLLLRFCNLLICCIYKFTFSKFLSTSYFIIRIEHQD